MASQRASLSLIILQMFEKGPVILTGCRLTLLFLNSLKGHFLLILIKLVRFARVFLDWLALVHSRVVVKLLLQNLFRKLIFWRVNFA